LACLLPKVVLKEAHLGRLARLLFLCRVGCRSGLGRSLGGSTVTLALLGLGRILVICLLALLGGLGRFLLFLLYLLDLVLLSVGHARPAPLFCDGRLSRKKKKINPNLSTSPPKKKIPNAKKDGPQKRKFFGSTIFWTHKTRIWLDPCMHAKRKGDLCLFPLTRRRAFFPSSSIHIPGVGEKRGGL